MVDGVFQADRDLTKTATSHHCWSFSSSWMDVTVQHQWLRWRCGPAGGLVGGCLHLRRNHCISFADVFPFRSRTRSATSSLHQQSTSLFLCFLFLWSLVSFL
ncbi:hypothetical protein BRADI_3g20858v3 [Brachypodium distachyon]|uniref:Uncharacterized protein n=1 Tax=Brachypodium distachyon TaxID=15368 RepID=A0A2K2CYJ7_BRADI|nr:hypothetical protein BRADI_3g20858v3 [Brachypodium distachyon]PNT67101.1 hypothetical protein BRADI_3g20858v3 [Brachypodium distachyon]PNT67102.1 hypothetical protein BRADI_3g20858v3 [Brachypodium distachyon]